MGLDEAALRRRLAKGAEVEVVPVSGSEDAQNLRELLTSYITALSAHEQKEEAEAANRAKTALNPRVVPADSLRAQNGSVRIDRW